MATYKHLRSSTANKRPTTTIVDGQLAINTNTASPGLFFKDSAGTGIVKVGPVHVGTTAPNSVPASGGSSGNYTGEQWLDTSVSPAQMKVWNGSTWVGIVADELPVSKLQDGAARQLIQTDAAGTGVEWTNSIDLPGTLDVTGASTLDSTLSVAGVATFAAGSAGSPSLTFTGDANTGVYTPGADQVSVATGGSERLRIDSTGQIEAVSLGTAAAPAYSWTGDPNTGIYSPGADQIAISTSSVGRFFINASGNVGINTASPSEPLNVARSGSDLIARFGTLETNAGAWIRLQGKDATGASNQFWDIRNNVDGSLSFNGNTSLLTERVRIDSFGRLLVGTSTSFGDAATVQSIGTNAYTFQGFRFGGDNGLISLGSAAGTQASPSILTTGNLNLGGIVFRSYDSAAYRIGAQITAVAESEWASADCPTRLVFSTTADGASSPTERLRITNDGVKAYNQTAPAAVNATATLTVANLKTGIITSTSAAATDMTLPTGTDTEAGFSNPYTNMTFEWSVINTGPSLVRVLAGTAHTIVGSGSVATGTSGRFASRRTAANTFVTYRLS